MSDLSTDIQNFADIFSKENDGCREYPVDALQSFIVSALVDGRFDEAKTPKQLLEVLLDAYRDVWNHALGAMKNICIVLQRVNGSIPAHETYLVRTRQILLDSGVSPIVTLGRVFYILDKIKRPTGQLLEVPVLHSLFGEKKMPFYRNSFKNCWIEFLRASSLLGKSMLVKLLRNVPDSVLPHISNPESIFASFFSDCFSQTKDGEVALLAVSGLFQLISRYNLGEPADLYSRLYCLVTAEVLESSRSNRVFQLLLKALKSDLMPNQYIPVFAKKMLRIATVVRSPSLSLWLVVAAFNLMQSHPIVSKPLIHREAVGGDLTKDPFDNDSFDIVAIAKTIGATSLWEIELLTNHSDPSVARMAALYKTNFFGRKAKRVSSDDYLLITDEQLFNRERKYGMHSNSKRSRGDVELENLVGPDRSVNAEISLL